MSPKKELKVGITQGDINGIGYEIIIKSLADNKINEICTPIVYGSSKVAAFYRKNIELENFSFHQIRSVNEANTKRSNLINVLNDDVKVEPGKMTPGGGEAAFISLKKAVEDLKNKQIDVLVTAPINKNNIQSDNFRFPGHTEYLASMFEGENALMLMVSDIMKIGVVAGHVPLQKVAGLITTENVLKKIKIINKSLMVDFGIDKPRIAVLSLNPHAGDGGLLGKEEVEQIIPAIRKAREEKILAFGAYAADGFFGSGTFKKFDAVLAMYHDQGLVPFKALNFDQGVNYTAGLSVVRTSPAHGTAYELVGKNTASETSFRQAIYLACDIYRKREEYKELISNPLPKFLTNEEKDN
ncbi:MAG: 4-hydroxythreonine-4-phosphate dehydrogenase PdxA [Bacteroidetes bacterium HGW-Bacteroidetes-21]|nr:MAG: 4-hydroxythreonine-4-phosphate dehydrogenase PdxA [Bacteroidetes bacterium HGW-Bacteroidetes-21]